MRAPLLAVALVVVAPLAGASSFTVTATDFAWSPNFFTAIVGDSVTWVNGGGIHNVRYDGGPVCALPCTETLPAAGLKNFFCAVHGTTMQGNIRVLAFDAPELVVQVVPGAASLDPRQASFRVDWQNQGTQPSGATTILVEYVDPSGARQVLRTLTVPAMNAPGAGSQQVVWNDGKLRTGPFTVVATIDPGALVAEADEANNEGSGVVSFLSPLVPRQQM